MKKIKWIAILIATILSMVLVGCANPANNGGSTPKYDYKVGDLVLLDGTVVPYTENPEFTDEQKQKAVAVIFRATNGAKRALGVGVKQTNVNWAKEETPGSTVNFADIKCVPWNDSAESLGNWDDSYTWNGDTDGSDNWEQICEFFEAPEQSANKEEGQNISNYPAFNYVQNYATDSAGDSKLVNTTYAENWYLPSIAELVEIYQSKTIVNQVLNALGSENAQPMKEGNYWSSSLSSDGDSVVVLSLGSAYIACSSKTGGNGSHNTCVVRAF